MVYDLEFTTPCWSATSSLYYTLTNFRGGGQGPLAPPPLNTPCNVLDRLHDDVIDLCKNLRNVQNYNQTKRFMIFSCKFLHTLINNSQV